MGIEIRELTTDDIETVAGIIGAHEPADGECARRYYEGYVNDSNRLYSEREKNFVAVEGETDEICGVCGYAPDKYDSEDIIWLTWFYVSPDKVGLKIGKKLLDDSLKRIRKLGVRKVYLDTGSGPVYEKAIEVYNKKYGFVIEGRLKNYYTNQDCIVMGLEL